MNIYPSLLFPVAMCGVIGVIGLPGASKYALEAVEALQHRGQEGAGIVTSDSKFEIHEKKGQGLVQDVFSGDEDLEDLEGDQATAHVRYSTTGASKLKNVQPIVSGFQRYILAVSHNGNFVNSKVLRRDLEAEGAIFQTTTDTELVHHLIARSKQDTLEGKIKEALRRVDGAYSIVILAVDKNNEERTIFAAKDPYGMRPLCMGELNGGHIVSSENCAFERVGARFIREINPGELVRITDQGYVFDKLEIDYSKRKAKCIFEYIYLARPDSEIFGTPLQVSEFRKESGRRLAEERGVDADIVIGVPDSGIFAALGYAEKSGIPYDQGFIRNHYVGRTFINPEQSRRSSGVTRKLSAIRSILSGKRVVVVDDSIVRGTTSKRIVRMVRELGGAKEVHLRLASPPIIGSCYYGIDTPERKHLVAANLDLDGIRNYVTADSLGYLSVKGLQSIQPDKGFCNGCFNLKYPTELYDKAA